MKKVNNNQFAEYLFDLYNKKRCNLVFEKGDVYKVDTGSSKADVKKVMTMLQPEKQKGGILSHL